MSFTSTTNRNDYIGNGSTDTYSYTFRIFEDSDLQVTVRDTDDVETSLTLTTDYTVSGAGDAGGGSITLVAGNLTTDYAITIRRVRPLTQDTDIRNQGDFYPETHEDVFDHVVMIAQQQQDELDRTSKLSETVTSADFDPTIPSTMVGESNRVMMTNQAGDGFSLGPSASEISGATVYTLFRSYVELDNTDSPYTVGVGDTGKVFLCDCSSGAVTINLPDITSLTNQGPIAFKKTDSSNNTLTINRGGSDTIEGSTAMSITSPETGFILVSTEGDTDWRLVGKFYSVVNAYGLFRTYATYEFADSPVTLNNESSGLLVRCDCTNGAISVTLPQISSMTTMGPIAFKKTDTTSNTVFINRSGSDTVDGGTSYSFTYNDATIIFVPNSTDNAWVVTGNIYGDNAIFEGTGAITVPRGTTAQRPGTGVNGMVRYNSDSNTFEGYQNSAWSEIGAGGGTAGINYCDNGSAEADTTGWSTYADAAGVSPVDGTGGSPNVTFVRQTVGDLRGSALFRFNKGAANRQGEGVSYDFSIDEADKGRMINVSFDYIAGANYAADDMHVWIYDVTNSALIPLTPYKLEGTSDNDNHQFSGTFQTAIDSISYRLILHVSTSNTSDYDLDIDNIQIGPQIKSVGPAVTDWKSYTPTITNGGTTSTNAGFWRRVGDSMEIHFHTEYTAAGAASPLTYSLPSGYSIDTSKVDAAASEHIGNASWINTGTNVRLAKIDYDTSTTFTFFFDSASVNFNGDNLANQDKITGTLIVPIAGWSSNVEMSDDAETRVVAARYSSDAGTQVLSSGSQDIINFEDIDYDTHNAVTTGSSWKYTAPVAGKYHIDARIRLESTAAWEAGETANLRLFKNGVVEVQLADVDMQATINPYVMKLHGSATIELAAGDYIDIRGYQNSGSGLLLHSDGTSNLINIERISGPSQIAASEFVGCRYSTSTASNKTQLETAILFDSQNWDTHGSYNTSTGIFTCPVAGKYRLSVIVSASSLTSGSYLYLRITKNGGLAKQTFCYASPHLATQYLGNMDDLIDCNAGDTLSVYLASDDVSYGLVADASYNVITIDKLN